jgi:uncharacterized membrane protein
VVAGMSNWPTFYLVLFWLAVGSAAAALIALPFVYARGMRQIDDAMSQLWADRDERESVSNVRVLARYELARRMERNRRKGGGAA